MSLNFAVFEGRIVKDIEIKMSKNNKELALYTVAVQRNFKNKEGKYDADFIHCLTNISSEKQKEYLEKWIKKGQRVIVQGRFKQSLIQSDEHNMTEHFTLITKEVTPISYHQNESVDINVKDTLDEDPLIMMPMIEDDEYPFI